MSQNNHPFPEQNEPEKIQGTVENASQKEKYIRDAGKIEDLPDTEPVPKMKSDLPSDNTDIDEGHSREWQDRARVVSDAKDNLNQFASPNQSPETTGEQEDVEEKGTNLREKNNQNY